MARRFDGSSDYLTSASTINLSGTATLGISVWFWIDAYVTSGAYTISFDTGGAGVAGGFRWVADGGGASQGMSTWNASETLTNTATFSNPSPGGWHHYVFNFDRSLTATDVHVVYVDGVSQTIAYSPAGNPTGNFGNLTLSPMGTSAAFTKQKGRMAELALWSTELTSGNVTSLYNGGLGADPRSVAAGTLVAYWPICGLTSPEPAVVGSTPLTVTGTVFAEHPIIATRACGDQSMLLGSTSM